MELRHKLSGRAFVMPAGLAFTTDSRQTKAGHQGTTAPRRTTRGLFSAAAKAIDNAGYEYNLRKKELDYATRLRLP